MSENYRKKTAGWFAGAALVAAVTAVSGCSDSSDSSDSAGTATEKPTAQGSAAADSGEKEKDGAGAPQPGAEDQSTPEGAVGMFITAIIEDDKKQACLAMGTPATGSAPAKANTASICESDSPEVQQMNDLVERLRTSFTPKQPTSDPTVKVAQVPAAGGKAVVPGKKITVDGQTLNKIILSHSTGLKPGQLNVRFEATEIGSSWYVTNMDLNIG